MAIKPVIVMGTELLSEPSAPVERFGTSELYDLIEDMKDTMKEKRGVGIAAPQIGVYQRVIMLGFEKSDRYPGEGPLPLTILINPEVEITDETKINLWEGCLSIPGLRGLVPRFSKLKFTAYTPEGKKISGTAENFHARVLQHECDHIDGNLYVSHVENWKCFGFEEAIWERVYGVAKPPKK
jgi:peptide deformylase